MTTRTTRIFWGVVATLLAAAPAAALPPYGPLEIVGNVQSQTLLRMRDVDQYQVVQNRNTLRLRVDYGFLKNGRAFDRIDIPAIRNAHLFVLYRGVYDSIYDIAPGGNLYGNLDQSTGSIAGMTDHRRDALKFENDLREAFVDLDLAQIPVNLRIGKQQIVWGETDNFRMLDRANPLNLRWHQTYESWDDLRIPLWMIKILWKIGEAGPFTDAFFETYWDPGDWVPAKQGFMPDYPWGVPYINPLTGVVGTNGLFGSLYKNTVLFRQGAYSRDPGGNSQVGARFSAITPQMWIIPDGIQFSFNYFYQRWAGDDGSNYAPIEAITDLQTALAAARNNQLPAEFIAPYVHTVGFSLNYADEAYTQTVYRMETVADFGVPFTNTDKPSPLGLPIYGVTKRDMWKGMIAFDRPTWIRFLNRKSTFFLSGQWFWHYLFNNLDALRGGTDPSTPSQDNIRNWESVVTFLATTYYWAGTLVPTASCGIDLVNSYNMYVGWNFDYFLTNEFILRLGQNYFFTPNSRAPAFESWSLGGLNRGRSETVLRMTYQF